MSVDLKLTNLLDVFDNIPKGDDIWQSFFEHTQTLGVDALIYYHLPPPGSLDFDEKTFVTHGFDPESVNHYSRKYCSLVNPFGNRSLSFDKPVPWRDLQTDFGFSDEEWLFLKGPNQSNHLNGIAIPAHGQNNRNGVIILRFADEHRQCCGVQLRSLQFASQYAHIAYCRFQIQNRKKQPALTAREREILRWVAHGKSNAVIADIVGISRHTVNGYLRRIYLKTGTSDRTTASLRAIGEGLINY